MTTINAEKLKENSFASGFGGGGGGDDSLAAKGGGGGDGIRVTGRSMTYQSHKERWNNLMKAKLANIKQVKDLEKSDQNIKIIMEVLRDLFQRKIDVVDETTLLNMGGQLLESYASAGVTTSIKRAERDAAEQSYDEMLAATTILNRASDVTVTEARAEAKEQLGEFSGEILVKEQEYNAYQAIIDAAAKTIVFLQSALKIKVEERRATARFGDQPGGEF